MKLRPQRKQRPRESRVCELKCGSTVLLVRFDYLLVGTAAPPTWFDMDEEKNRNVYVSGLPLDITLEEFVEMMSKCGIIMADDDGKSLEWYMLGVNWVEVTIGREKGHQSASG